MIVFIGVVLVSTAGWLFSLLSPRSAARRHLVLSTALAASLLLPMAAGVRSGTDWTLLVIQSSATGSERAARTPSRDQRIEPRFPLREQAVDGRASILPAAKDVVREVTHQDAPRFSGRQQTNVESDILPPATAGQSVHGERAKIVNWDAAKHWGVVAYALIAGVLLLRIVVSLVVVQRVKRRSTKIDALPDGVHVLEADVTVPLAVGFGTRAIVLPRGFRDWVGPEELRDVFAHEAEHLRRGDHWIMLLQHVAAAVYWPILTVHLLNRALIRAREELCDNAVLARRDPAAYGQTLLTVAERVGETRGLVALAAPSVLWRGDLERRVAGLLDHRRDRRTRMSRRITWTAAGSLLAALVLASTTRMAVIAEEPAPGETEAATSDANARPAPRGDIQWTGVPTVSVDDPTLHRGVVLGPHGKPLPGASVYAASTIELLQLADADDVGVPDLGPVRAVTDAEGRFEFHAEDLSWVTSGGERKRWETLLVATKEGLAPGWLRTWGDDRSLRSHWHPMQSLAVAVRTRPSATLTGRFLLEDGEPLADARVRLTGLLAPVEYDLDVHIPQEEQEEVVPHGLFTTVDYAEMLYRPWVLPGLEMETTTAEDGRFELPGLPEGFIARIEVTHPRAVTTEVRVAVRPIEPVYRKPLQLLEQSGEPTPTLFGSGFSTKLPKGAVLRGHVTFRVGFDKRPASGVIVALANHNSPDGMSGQRFSTDAEGQFTVTGLPHDPRGYELAFAGSSTAPFGSRRERVFAGVDADVMLTPAVPYRLKLTDPQGNPVDREVYSIEVQEVPGTSRRDIKSRFNDAERVAPGVYRGIVPLGPGAVLVKRGARTDRPAAVDPKAFFAPGRTDWTLEEQRYAYGDAWRIARPAIIETDALSVGMNPAVDQLELAAVVFTNEQAKNGVLELTATVHSHPPVKVTLVDDDGKPVAGANVKRQLERYNGEDLPETFSVYGLHPERAEFLVFTHENRRLIGTLTTTWTGDSVRVVMRPAATLIGRITDASGKPNDDFGIRVLGEQLPPDTFVAGRVYNPTETPGERPGEFRLVLAPGAEVHGEFVRMTPDRKARPSVATAFGPLTPQPGQMLDLGQLIVP